MRRLSWMAALTLSVAACGGEGALGDECGEEGVTEGECEQGTICGDPGDGAVPECLQICEEQSDCPSAYECNGVSNSNIKACRPKDDGSGGSGSGEGGSGGKNK